MKELEKILSKIQEAVKDIYTGKFEKIYVHKDCVAYLVPTPNPDVFTIRLDIRVNRGA